MSDLQCPATLVLIRLLPPDAVGSPPDAVGSVRGLAGPVAGPPRVRFARLYAGPDDLGVSCGSVLGDALGLPVSVLPGLTAPTSGATEASRGVALEEVIDALADLHRGETVLALVPDALMAVGIGSGGSAAEAPVVTVVVDADGWTVGPGLPAAR